MHLFDALNGCLKILSVPEPKNTGVIACAAEPLWNAVGLLQPADCLLSFVGIETHHAVGNILGWEGQSSLTSEGCAYCKRANSRQEASYGVQTAAAEAHLQVDEETKNLLWTPEVILLCWW